MDSSPFVRYSRQVLFPNIGVTGQKKLTNSRVVVVGMGALGTVIANHLARSGVGYIRMIDRDFVEHSNLQRQILFDEEDANTNRPKAIAASNKLKKINSEIILDPVVTDVHALNAEELLTDVDLIIDGTDNFFTRYIINDVSVKSNIPWIHGAAVRSRGMVAVFSGSDGPCYQCLFPGPPQSIGETCDLVGVISPVTVIVGSVQAAETIKFLVGSHSKLNHHLIQFDLWTNDKMIIDLTNSKNSNCSLCVHHRYDYLSNVFQDDDYTTLCGRNAVQISPRTKMLLDLERFEEKLKNIGTVVSNPFLLKCHLDETITLVLFENGRVIIQGTDDIAKAKTLYDKFIGA